MANSDSKRWWEKLTNEEEDLSEMLINVGDEESKKIWEAVYGIPAPFDPNSQDSSSEDTGSEEAPGAKNS
jgi:hypothetical protein